MKCPNEDCLHVFTRTDKSLCPNPKCEYELTERDKAQIYVEQNASMFGARRELINRTREAIEWGGMNTP